MSSKIGAFVSKEQRKLNDLHRVKKQINENIKSLSCKLRMLSERTKQHSLQGQRPFRSKISEQVPPKSQESLQHPHLNTQEAGIKQVVDAQVNIRDRNKRLFGGLSSYLKKASSKLEEQSKKVKEKLTLQEKVVQKERDKTLQFEENQRKQIEVTLEMWNSRKLTNSKQILQTENTVLKNKFTAYVSDLQNCLFTKAQPSIAWKPSVDGQLLKKQHQQSQLQTKLKAHQVIESITSYNEVFDYSKYLSENQMEYYRNYLENYLKSKQHFFCTKTKPTLLWKPVAMNDKLKESLELSKASLIDESKHISEANDVYCKKTSQQVVMVEERSQGDSESFPE